MKVKWKTRSSRVKSEAQNWAQNRNWLLSRVKSISSILYQIQIHYPDAATRSNLQDMTAALTHMQKRIENLNSYKVYQQYRKDLKEDV